jgi:putative ABC transport system permease protein
MAFLTLALCIGANTAIFSMVYALVLKPLPFPEPSRIVEIYNAFPKAGFNKFPTNLVQYADFKANAPSFDALGLFGQTTVMVGDEGSAERIQAAECTAEMFDVLGIKPVFGQFFTLKNSRVGEDKVVVLTESFWKSHYNEDPGVLDKTMRVNGETYRIIGVAPRALEAFNAQDRGSSGRSRGSRTRSTPRCGTPATCRCSGASSRGSRGQGLGEVEGLEQHFYDTTDPGFKELPRPNGPQDRRRLVQAERVEPIKSSLYLLQGGVIFVLLIGCVNVANLLLTRPTASRASSPSGRRSAPGAGPSRRQLTGREPRPDARGRGARRRACLRRGPRDQPLHPKLLPNMLPIAIDGDVLGCTDRVAVAVGLLIGSCRSCTSCARTLPR